MTVDHADDAISNIENAIVMGQETLILDGDALQEVIH
jgi:hypothetical protein